MINFYSVSLLDNKKTIEKCLVNLRKLYKDKFNYTIICPKDSCHAFREIKIIRNIRIIDEDTIISFSKFKNLALNISNTNKQKEDLQIKVNENRLGWYYQQVLKLSYLLEESKIKPLTMIDADTILINKLSFYSGDKSNLFATHYEKNKAYWQTLNTIFNYKIPFNSWISTTCQINSLTPCENIALVKKLEDFIPRNNDMSMGEWITKIMVKAVISTHGKLDNSLFGEQDFIGYFLRYNFGTIPRKILFLREKVNFKLTNTQEFISSLLGFKHITYESWLIKDKNKALPWLDFTYIIIFSFAIPFMRKIKSLIILQ